MAQESEYDWMTVLLLCFFLGGFGAHRFYTGKEKAILMPLTAGGCGLWALYDLFKIITEDFEDGEGRVVAKD